MYRIKIDNKIEFKYGMEFSLLDSIENQTLNIDYNCRAGFCGSCKCTLLSGEVNFIQPQTPLIPIKEDEILTCCCRPKTDLEIAFSSPLQKMSW